ncbi:competence protein CoiA [Metabacillus indicus]|uniref:competence protein CoiA n=1 Tax=Metabacillus indicus TaxID=246786 RepID=UPI00068E12CB|nr:competence protein CoiA family protein [Metabacillus indicus]
MLIAKDADGRLINLTSIRHDHSDLHRMREKKHYCPVCDHPLDLKAGSIVIPHFAHQKLKSCLIDHEPESDYHLNGKIQLYRWLKSQNLVQTEMERYFPEIMQRPDVYADTGQRKIAVEFQCSSIPAVQFYKRTSQYKQANIEPLWILGAKNAVRLSSTTFRISPFQWLFAKQGPDILAPPHLLTYCSSLQAFLLIEHLIPFSKQVFTSIPAVKPIRHITLRDVSPQAVPSPQYWIQWLNLIKMHRLKPHIHLSEELKSLQQTLYEKKQIPLSCLPSEAFIPVATGYLFHTAVYVWQTKILLFIDSLSGHSVFRLEDAVNEMKRDRHIVRRDITHMKHVSIGAPVRAYLEALTQTGLIAKENKYSYKKTADLKWSQNQEELLKRDNELLSKR